MIFGYEITDQTINSLAAMNCAITNLYLGLLLARIVGQTLTTNGEDNARLAQAIFHCEQTSLELEQYVKKLSSLHKSLEKELDHQSSEVNKKTGKFPRSERTEETVRKWTAKC